MTPPASRKPSAPKPPSKRFISSPSTSTPSRPAHERIWASGNNTSREVLVDETVSSPSGKKFHIQPCCQVWDRDVDFHSSECKGA